MLYLLVGIDTESDDQWSLESRRHPTFENIYALPSLHSRFQRYGVRPTYFITHPVARDRRSAAVLRDLLHGRDCEVGAHHHAWETPPCVPEDIDRHAYALSLPDQQFEDQARQLSEAIAGAVGEAPFSYRSGRFGFSVRHVPALERTGYRVDSSVAPLFYEGHKGGPDFVDVPETPYFLSYDDAARAGSSNVLEVPVSAGLHRRLPAFVQRWYGRAPRPYTTKRILRKLGLARMQWLRPSYSDLADMQALARRLKREGVPVLNVIFHSSEIIAGGSPYNRNAAELEAFFDRLDRFLAFAGSELGATPVTFSEFRALYCGRGLGGAPAPGVPPS
jgi:hypothetical protein